MLTKNLPSKFFRTLSTFGALFLILTLSSAYGTAANKTKILFQFTGSDGSDPFAGPTLDAAGNIYGTTVYLDGTDGAGTVFKLTQNSDGSWTETVLTDFSAGGENPSAPVIFDTAGNLYGTTTFGGEFGVGTVFELSPNLDGSWTETVLHNFTGADGAYPDNGPLVFDSAGNLYGTTFYQAGVGNVFELSPNPGGQNLSKGGGKGKSMGQRPIAERCLVRGPNLLRESRIGTHCSARPPPHLREAEPRPEETVPADRASKAVEQTHEPGIECRHGGSEHAQRICDPEHASLPERTCLVEVGKGHRPQSLRRCSEAGTSRGHAESKAEGESDQGTCRRVGAGAVLDPAS